MKKIAIIGSGIAGLGSAWFLHRDFEVTVFEAGDHAGGHTHTVSVEEEGRDVPIDTGFMVFNHVTYPNLVRLFKTLAVPTKRTDMSFSVQHRPRALEYCGSSINHLFSQRRNLLRPSFYRMLFQIDRFNREALRALGDPSASDLTLGEYVKARRYGDDFLRLYLLPMSSAVWSTPPGKMLQFPAVTLIRFFHNHGFLGLHTQHPWWTVEGGARTYVEKLIAGFRRNVRLHEPVRAVRRPEIGGIEVVTDGGTQVFDKAILACHPPETLKLLGEYATPDERTLLSAFQYQPNTAILHTDESVMPRTRRAWASWNYRIDGSLDSTGSDARVSTHYWMNRLQGVSDKRNYFVTLSNNELVDSSKIVRTIPCEHPLFDLRSREAQGRISQLNFHAAYNTETYFAGAWQRHGFHEDGLLSAVNLCALILNRDPWQGTS